MALWRGRYGAGTALFISISVEDCLTTMLGHFDAQHSHYKHLHDCTCRFLHHCLRQSALKNISNELLSGCDTEVVPILKSDHGHQPQAKMRRTAFSAPRPFLPLNELKVLSQKLPSQTTFFSSFATLARYKSGHRRERKWHEC